jgi:hypothetical protein
MFLGALSVRFDADFSAGLSVGVFRPLATLFFRMTLFFERGFVDAVVASRPATLAVRGCRVILERMYVSFLRFRRMTIHHSNSKKMQVQCLGGPQGPYVHCLGLYFAIGIWRGAQ